MTSAEERFIARLVDAAPADWPLGPGDDGAQLPDGNLVALDTVVEGVHFEPGTAPGRVAHKAVAACLSDLCALGAPLAGAAVFVSAQLPPGCDADALAHGLVAACRRFAVHLGGGDTVRSQPGALALAVTAIARLPEDQRPWRRDGARPGDRLWVSGPLGGSRGGRHLDVRPRADVVAALRAAAAPVRAAMDLSDGLGVDLPRLTRASGVGAEVAAGAVPIHPDAAGRADPLAAALGDGEDFELLLALPAEHPGPPQGHCVGRVTDGALLLIDAAGRPRPWPAGGYSHAF